MVSEFRA